MTAQYNGRLAVQRLRPILVLNLDVSVDRNGSLAWQGNDHWYDLGMDDKTTYERLGGEDAIRGLVDRFYDLMGELPETQRILDLHPKDLTESRDKLFKFLSGFFGGPSLYIQQYGHPMLRARHLPFPISENERDQWLLCMNKAVDELVEDSQLAAQLKATFFRTADHMRNRPE